MGVTELTREQMLFVKQAYLCQLADEGSYAEVMGVDWNEPSYGELAAADELVPDEVILEMYAATVFSEDDFPHMEETE